MVRALRNEMVTEILAVINDLREVSSIPMPSLQGTF